MVSVQVAAFRPYAGQVETIPLFPLGMVLFPGMVLPLRVFEPRYLALMEKLLTRPEGIRREFGVVAIRQGWEVGADAASALYPIGCTATLRRAARLDDETFDIVTVGADRFRLGPLDVTSEPYLQAEVQRLPDELGPGEESAVLAHSVLRLYRDYLAALADTALLELPGGGGLAEVLADLPDDPLLLASLVAATAPLELGDRQSLLAARDGVSRLRAELRLLKREATMFARLRAVPVPLAQWQLPGGLN